MRNLCLTDIFLNLVQPCLTFRALGNIKRACGNSQASWALNLYPEHCCVPFFVLSNEHKCILTSAPLWQSTCPNQPEGEVYLGSWLHTIIVWLWEVGRMSRQQEHVGKAFSSSHHRTQESEKVEASLSARCNLEMQVSGDGLSPTPKLSRNFQRSTTRWGPTHESVGEHVHQ